MARPSGDQLPWTSWSRRRTLPVAPTMSTWTLEDDLQQLQMTMLTMLADPALSDVYLVVGDIDIPAHKSVLAAWSRPFRAMFTLPMLESQHKCRVVIEEAEHRDVKIMLDYLYSGRVGLNDQNVMPVSALANRYEILPLMKKCEGYMKWRLSPNNVCRHLLAAEDHQCAYMASFALEYLAVHFDEVHHAGCSDFDGNDFNALANDVVLRVLQHEGLTVDEETVFLAVDGWAKAWRKRRALSQAAATARPSKREAQQRLEQLAKAAHQERAESNLPDQSRFPDCVSGSRSGPGEPGAKESQSTRFEVRGEQGQRHDNIGNSLVENKARVRAEQGQQGERSSSGREGHAGGADREDGKASRAPRSGLRRKTAAGVQIAPVVKIIQRASVATWAPASGGNQGITVITMPKILSPFISSSSSSNGRAETGSTEPNKYGRASDASTAVVILRSTEDPEAGVATTAAGPRGRTRERSHKVTISRTSLDGGTAAADGRMSDDSSSDGTGVGGIAGRMASLSLPPPLSPGMCKETTWSTPKSVDGTLVADGLSGSPSVGKEENGLEGLPEEERASLDELFEEIRFPLMSTIFLCQVVEKSASVAGSRVAQRLLDEAYRFQAIRNASSADVDEFFPGNHRVKYRGYERVLFGEGEGCVGTVDDYSSSLSEVHLVENVQRRDEKYWLPGQPEEAYVCIRLDRVRRITKFRFQNRYSEEFELAVRRTRREEWQVIVPRQPSGGHKDVKELDLMRKRVKARHVKISLRGRKRSCYNTSVYWTELLGF